MLVVYTNECNYFYSTIFIGLLQNTPQHVILSQRRRIQQHQPAVQAFHGQHPVDIQTLRLETVPNDIIRIAVGDIIRCQVVASLLRHPERSEGSRNSPREGIK